MKYIVFDGNKKIEPVQQKTFKYKFLNIRAMEGDKFKGILHGEKKGKTFSITEITGETKVREGLYRKLKNILPEGCKIELL